MFGKLRAPFSSVWSHLKEVGGFLRDPSELTLEDFRLELAELGLSGRSFGPEEYRVALEEYLNVGILVKEVPDAEGGALAGQLAAEGVLAEVVADEESRSAVILVRESLRYRPWPAYELSVFHELSHLAAGHPLRAKRAQENDGGSKKLRFPNSKLARRDPKASSREEDLEKLKREVLEPEARKRAKWLVLAGTCPEAFEAEKANRLT